MQVFGQLKVQDNEHPTVVITLISFFVDKVATCQSTAIETLAKETRQDYCVSNALEYKTLYENFGNFQTHRLGLKQGFDILDSSIA